jgi:hypothetical protein
MSKQLHTMGLIIGMFIVLSVQALPALAEITKDIKIDSKPEGAEVYSPEGTRNRLLGKTPFVYRAEFHSEISVIRLLLKKNPFKDATIEVSAKQDHIMVTFEAQEYAMKPELQKDAHLRRIQESINPVINQAVPQFLEAQQGTEFELSRPVAVVSVEGNTVLLVDLSLVRVKNEIKGSGKERYDQLSEALWEELRTRLAMPLVKKVRSVPEITGIIMRVGLDEQRHLFSIDRRIEQTVEMKCMPGTRTEYRFEYRGTQLVQVPYTVYDPCLNKVPVTRREMKLDPHAGVSRDQTSVLYVLSREATKSDISSKSFYDKLGILVTNSKGDQLKRSGSIPTAFVPGKTKDNSESAEKDLIEAAREGDLVRVKSLIAAGADVNAKDTKWGSTALMEAAIEGRVEVVEALLAAKADVNATSNDGTTALMEASGYGTKESLIRYAKGGHELAKSKEAAKYHKVADKLVQALLAAKADVNAKDNRGNTALKGASVMGHAEVAKLLRQAGAKE